MKIILKLILVLIFLTNIYASNIKLLNIYITYPENNLTIDAIVTYVKGYVKPVEDVKIFVNDIETSYNNKTGEFFIPQIPLRRGENNIIIYANDKYGKFKGRKTVKVFSTGNISGTFWEFSVLLKNKASFIFKDKIHNFEFNVNDSASAEIQISPLFIENGKIKRLTANRFQITEFENLTKTTYIWHFPYFQCYKFSSKSKTNPICSLSIQKDDSIKFNDKINITSDYSYIDPINDEAVILFNTNFNNSTVQLPMNISLNNNETLKKINVNIKPDIFSYPNIKINELLKLSNNCDCAKFLFYSPPHNLTEFPRQFVDKSLILKFFKQTSYQNYEFIINGKSIRPFKSPKTLIDKSQSFIPSGVSVIEKYGKLKLITQVQIDIDLEHQKDDKDIDYIMPLEFKNYYWAKLIVHPIIVQNIDVKDQQIILTWDDVINLYKNNKKLIKPMILNPSKTYKFDVIVYLDKLKKSPNKSYKITAFWATNKGKFKYFKVNDTIELKKYKIRN